MKRNAPLLIGCAALICGILIVLLDCTNFIYADDKPSTKLRSIVNADGVSINADAARAGIKLQNINYSTSFSQKVTTIENNASLDIQYIAVQATQHTVFGKLPSSIKENLKIFVTEDGTLSINIKESKSSISKIFNSNDNTPTIYVMGPMPERLMVRGSGSIKMPSVKGSHQASGDFGVFVRGSGDIEISGIEAPNGNIEAMISGSGDIDIKRASAKSLTVSIMGSGDCKINNITAQRGKYVLAGSGEIEVSGKCTDAQFSLIGSGDIEAEKLIVQNGQVSISGSGDIDAYIKNVTSLATPHNVSRFTNYYRK